MTFSVKITPRAQQDLKNIGRYTLKNGAKRNETAIYVILTDVSGG